MERPSLTLTFAFALLLTADSPLLTLSHPLSNPPLRPQPPPPPPLRSSLPPPRSPSLRTPRRSLPPPPTASPRPPPSPPIYVPPFPPPRPSAKSNDVPGTPRRPPPLSPPRWSGQPPSGLSRGTAHEGLNLGKKVGLTFVAVVVVLQVVFGGFLIFKRREMRKAGCQRDVASSSAS